MDKNTVERLLAHLRTQELVTREDLVWHSPDQIRRGFVTMNQPQVVQPTDKCFGTLPNCTCREVFCGR